MEINPHTVGHTARYPQPRTETPSHDRHHPGTDAPAPIVDEVEFSEAALRASEARVDDPLVARVREEIAAGTYLTEDRIDQAVERLFERLNGAG